MRLGVLGVSAGGAFLIGVAVGLAVLLFVLALAAGRRRPVRRGPDIPSVMRAAPSDADLEKPVLENLQAWGFVLILFFAIWIPVVFLTENSTNKDDTKELVAQSIDRGYLTTLPGTEENQLGFNCQRCHGPGLHGGQNVYNSRIVIVPDLQTVCGGSATGHPLIHSLTDVVDTIAQGRAGTDMPSWSVKFAGAMDDQQINDLVNYILSIQKVPFNQNVCTNPIAAATPSASASASPSAGASATPSAGASASASTAPSASGAPSPSPSP